MSKPTPEPTPCPCDLGAVYFECCGRFHAGALHLQAPDASTLMRSRYSAYVLGLHSYLLQTWHPGSRPESLDATPPGLRWLGLEVQATARQGTNAATVRFVARSKLAGRAHRLLETSRFVLEDGRWYYVNGDVNEELKAI